MKTNIFVPQKINVGFQNRSDTYTGKLAYVIYYDEKGKLRKETSWQSWRDKKIPNEEYENVPTEGFVLNKKVGGVEESYGWDVRKTYTRIYDPRGFEFEITIPNLLWILENCNCIKGKGLEGEFVYGWDGKDLVLVPVDTPDYKEIEEKNKIIHNNEFIKAKELIVGATYETLNGEKYVYMGKFDTYYEKTNFYYDGSYWSNRTKGYEYDVDDSWMRNKLSTSESLVKIEKGKKEFFFILLGKPNAEYQSERENSIQMFKSINKKLAKAIDTNCHPDYIEFVDMLNHYKYYSPIDYSKDEIFTLPFEGFVSKANSIIKASDERRWGLNFYVGIMVNDKLDSKCITYDKEKRQFYYSYEEPCESYRWGRIQKTYQTKIKYFESLVDLYKDLNPVYGVRYLENGNVHERKYYYE